MWTYLGQNFLIDAKVRQYIADHILKLYEDLWCEALIEIGPGKWAITRLIKDVSPNFYVIEKDTTLKLHLNEILDPSNPPPMGTSNPPNPPLSRGTILWWDVLDVDIHSIECRGTSDAEKKKINTKKTLVVGNLPYYITSPIMRKFFSDPRLPHFVRNDKASARNDDSGFAGGIFMVQDEVALRLDSDVKKKSYLRWLLNYAYQVKYLKWVPAKCFKPAPKVKSALIELRTKNLELRPDFQSMIKFLDLYSPFTRKTLGAIEKMIDKRFADKSPGVSCDDKSLSGDKKIKSFTIPEHLRKKRLEELKREELGEIL